MALTGSSRKRLHETDLGHLHHFVYVRHDALHTVRGYVIGLRLPLELQSITVEKVDRSEPARVRDASVHSLR